MYLPVLMYHGLSGRPLTREEDPPRIFLEANRFEKQLRFLKWLGYETVRLEDYQRALVSGDNTFRTRGRFAITFDDGYREVLTLGLPILKKLGMTAAVFAVTDRIGQTNTWDTGTMPLMTAAELREWGSAGMEIGAHTRGHPRLTRLTSGEALSEIKGSRETLSEIMGRKPELFAYPYGDWNEQVQLQTRESGFTAAWATDRGPASHERDLFALRRVILFRGTTLAQLVMKIRPWYPRYRDWSREGKR